MPNTARGYHRGEEEAWGSYDQQSQSPSPSPSPPLDMPSPRRGPSSTTPPTSKSPRDRERDRARSPHRHKGPPAPTEPMVVLTHSTGCLPMSDKEGRMSMSSSGSSNVDAGMLSASMGTGVMERPMKHNSHHHHHRHHTTTRHGSANVGEDSGSGNSTHPRRRSSSSVVPPCLSPSMFVGADRPGQNQSLLPPSLALASASSHDRHSGSKSMRSKTGSSRRVSVGREMGEDTDSGADIEIGDPEQTISFLDKLGEGNFGSVWKAQHVSGKILAVKKVPRDEALEITKEVDFMKDLRKSSYLVRYYASCNVKTELWIVMEYCAAGSLRGMMKICGRNLSENEIAVATCHMLRGLHCLHASNKLHRDIKAANILVDGNGIAKLADFGVSGNGKQHHTMIGTPFWMAPEIIQDLGYDEHADIWSLGITCIELAEGEPPHFDVNPMRAMLQIPKWDPPTLTHPDKWSPAFNNFLARCLVKNPHQRPLSADLLMDPFVKPAENSSLLELVQLQEQMRPLQAPEPTTPQPSKDPGNLASSHGSNSSSSSILGNKGGSVMSTPVGDSDADLDMRGLSGIWSKFVLDNPALVGGADAEGEGDDELEVGDEAEDGGTTTEGQNSDLQTPRHSSCLESTTPQHSSFVSTPGSGGVTPLKPTFIDLRSGFTSHQPQNNAATPGTPCSQCEDLKRENSQLRAELDKVMKLNSQLTQRLEEAEEEVLSAKADADRIRGEFQAYKKLGNSLAFNHEPTILRL
ncbi:serine/threonine-protein kinase 3 [Pelomyxa schiedti]|nr:serine/threonine-protein kinase 3 [Pelomyxa schiedti]